jgi:hypothetical protein
VTVLLRSDPNSTISRIDFDDRGRFPIDLGLCHTAGVGLDPRVGGVGTLQSVKVNDLNPLWPKSMFRDEVMKYAKRWMKEYTRRGFEPAEPESEMRVWGPYRPYNWDAALWSDVKVFAYHDHHATARLLGVADFLLTLKWINPYGLVEVDEAPSNAAALACGLVEAREQEYAYLWRNH